MFSMPSTVFGSGDTTAKYEQTDFVPALVDMSKNPPAQMSKKHGAAEKKQDTI